MLSHLDGPPRTITLTTSLVHELPSKYCRLILVGYSTNAVHSSQYILQENMSLNADLISFLCVYLFYTNPSMYVYIQQSKCTHMMRQIQIYIVSYLNMSYIQSVILTWHTYSQLP